MIKGDNHEKNNRIFGVVADRRGVFDDMATFRRIARVVYGGFTLGAMRSDRSNRWFDILSKRGVS